MSKEGVYFVLKKGFCKSFGFPPLGPKFLVFVVPLACRMRPWALIFLDLAALLCTRI